VVEGTGASLGHATMFCILDSFRPLPEIAGLLKGARASELRVSTTPESRWLAELAAASSGARPRVIEAESIGRVHPQMGIARQFEDVADDRRSPEPPLAHASGGGAGEPGPAGGELLSVGNSGGRSARSSTRSNASEATGGKKCKRKDSAGSGGVVLCVTEPGSLSRLPRVYWSAKHAR